MNAVEIAESLINIGAVKLNFKEGFQWVSGIQSPIYCDNRLLISAVEERKKIAIEFAKLIRKDYPNCDLIAGTATAGIPHAAWVADELNLPMVYVRSKPKEHGKKSQIEGVLNKADKVVLIEDLVSTGKSSVAAVEALRGEGADVLSVLSIFSYQLKKSEQVFRSAKIPATSLCNVDALVEFGEKNDKFSSEEIVKLKDFFKNLEN